MKPLPDTVHPLVLRTDFSNQAAWETIRAIIRKPAGIFRFRANIEFLDDLEYEGIDQDRLLALIPAHYNHSFIVIVDRMATSQPDFPLLVLDLYEPSGRAFRAIPATIQSIENNLSIANMDFEEFANAADEKGVFRGFPKG